MSVNPALLCPCSIPNGTCWRNQEAAWLLWEGGRGRVSSTASSGWEAAWKAGCSEPRGSSQGELIMPGVRGWHGFLQGTKPWGNTPFLLELGAWVPVYKPFHNNWRLFV